MMAMSGPTNKCLFGKARSLNIVGHEGANARSCCIFGINWIMEMGGRHVFALFLCRVLASISSVA